LAAELAGHFLRAGRVFVHHGDQFDAGALLRQLVIDARMVASERAYAHHRRADWFFAGHCAE
jgi:hypothetical protein